MMRLQRSTLFIFALPLSLITAASLTGCGNTPRKPRIAYTQNSNFQSNDPVVDSPAQPQPTYSPTLPEPFQVPVKASGNAVVKMKVSAQRTLKIRFTPKVSTQKAPGQNYVAQYSKLGVTITVGDVTYTTGVLDNGLQSGRPQMSQVMDFSSAIPSGGGEMEITVESPLTDYYCYSVSWMACPYSPPIAPLLDLPWNGMIAIETDATGPV